MHKFSVECKSCKRKYTIAIESSDSVEVFAAICDCGEIFAGNYKNLGVEFKIFSHQDKRNYYTNGTFNLIPLNESYQYLASE